MKTVFKQLEKILDKLEEKIMDRECTFEDRSEKWQESEKGEFFEERTDQMREVFESVQLAIDGVGDFLEHNI